MPTLARFGKVKLQMYFLDHPPPHFHLTGPGFRVRVAVETLEVIDGRVQRAVIADALAWASEHRGLLRARWKEMAVG